ncbi:MAG: acyl-CoA thioesterase, partial [Desulfofustis sp.]|nr:acyl-CoA thioesterase [Desulfofustis sp.]
ADGAPFVFTTQYRVLYGDTDAGGVVYYANYLRYFELGRTELMRSHVCSYKEIEALGMILPVTETYARYKAPAFYDDLLTIETSIGELNKFRCKFNYRITRQDQNQSRPTLLVKGYTVNAAVTREGKLVQLPKDIMASIQSLA